MIGARITLLCAVPMLTACSSCGDPSSDASSIEPLSEPWQEVIPFQETPAGIPGIRAADCGVCHTAIYAEWRMTTHAVALQDLQFQSEWQKDGRLWLCINCHTPLANQLEAVTIGLYDGDFRRPVVEENARFDPTLRGESITCATCHVRDGAILGRGLGGSPPHPVRTDNETLSYRICLRCHNVSTVLTPTLLCSFTTGDEWAQSPARRDGQSCVDCHMATVERPIVEGGPVRTSHTHQWPGGGIAKFPADVDAVRSAYRRGYDIELEAHRVTTDRGPAVAIDLAIVNARAGHLLPTGDVERFIMLNVSVGTDGAEPLWTHQARIGELWEWYPLARQLSDNSLQPGERREFHLEAPLDGPVEGSLFVEVVAENHRMTAQNAELAGIFGRYPLSVETARERVEVATPASP